MEVHELAGAEDHRTGRLAGQETYFTGQERDRRFNALWDEMSAGPAEPLVLRRKGRDVTIPAVRNGVGRGTFAQFCGQPLGPGDYLAIAETVRVLFVEDVPLLGKTQPNEAKRLVTLIDALYEARTGLIVSAAAEPDALYPEGTGAFEFQRTASRLHEIRSAGWLTDN